jgi:hypothetical protein
MKNEYKTANNRSVKDIKKPIPWDRLINDKMLIAYLQLAQVQLALQLQSVQVQFRLPHFTLSGF